MKCLRDVNVVFQVVTLATLLVWTEAFDSYKLCPGGNITVFGAGHEALLTPARCFPTPVLDRNQLHAKPFIQIMMVPPGQPFRYTVLMLELNRTLDRYDVHWLEPNLTVDSSLTLIRSPSQPWDVTKMIEYQPPKQANYNLTYLILVFRQPPGPVNVPSRIINSSFRPNIWAANSQLTVVGGAEFLVRGASNTSITAGYPTHHQQPPLRLAPAPNVNQSVATFNRNFTNGTYPRPPSYNPHYYPPQPQPAYIPPQPQPPYRPYPGQPQPPYQPYPGQPQPPYQPYPGHKGGHRGGATTTYATVYLVILFSVLPFVFNM